VTISVVQTATNTSNSSTSSFGAGVTAGNWLVLLCANFNFGAITNPPGSPQLGSNVIAATLLLSQVSSGSGATGIAMWLYRIQAGDAGATTVTCSANGESGLLAPTGIELSAGGALSLDQSAKATAVTSTGTISLSTAATTAASEWAAQLIAVYSNNVTNSDATWTILDAVHSIQSGWKAVPSAGTSVSLSASTAAFYDYNAGIITLAEAGAEHDAAAALSGSGTLTAAAAKTVPAAASLSGTGALTAAASKTAPAAASLSGAGALTAGASKAVPAAAALSGSGALTAAASKLVPAPASLSGSGTLTAGAAKLVPAAAALSGTGTLTAGAAVGQLQAAAALSGSGALTAAALKVIPAAAALSGTGTLTAAARAGPAEQLILVSLGRARWLWTLGMARNSEGASMTSLSQSALSTQPVQVQVEAITVQGSAYDPTADSVAVAFVPQGYPPGSPGSGDWVTASWATDTAGNHWATALVGPANGGTVLAFGSYVAWVRVTDDPAVPALPGPILTIF
jgi:hypothetical protein